MLCSYACRPCRVRLSRRIATGRSPQWQPRATFLSFRDKTQNESRPQSQPQPQQQRDVQDEGQSRPLIRYSADQEQSQPRGRYSGRVEHHAESRRRPASTTQTNMNLAGLSRIRGHAGAIEAAMANNDIEKAWALFEKTYTSRDCKALIEPPLGDIALLKNGIVFRNLLRAVTSAFCSTKDKAIITPTAVLLKYEQLGLARHEYWARDTLYFLTLQAIPAVKALSKESAEEDAQVILLELLSVWRLFFQCKGINEVPLEPLSTEWNIPPAEALPDMYDDIDFGMRLQKFHPGYTGDAALGFCAVSFYNLSYALGAVESLHKDAEPFRRFLGRLLAGSRVDSVFKHTFFSYSFKDLPQEVRSRIISDINIAPKNALSELASRGETLGEMATDDEVANTEAFHLKRIVRAVGTKTSVQTLNRLWGEMLARFSKDGKPAIPRKIYNAFLTGYMVLLQAQRSVEVWNHMIAHGIKPDIQSWIAILDGCAKAKDLNGFNAMWTRMLSTGIEPDNYAWTTRISGLFSLHQVSLGLAALDDMGKRWVSAENVTNNPKTHPHNKGGVRNLPTSARAINKCTKPSVEVINGAITALVRIRGSNMRHDKRVEFIQKILAWAANFSIKPDTITYNSLIQLYLRAEDYGTAFKILSQMEKDGIKGDVATHSMLVTASFDNHSFDGLTASEQADKIIMLFNSIEAGGVRLNEYIYGTAIDRLLSQYSNHDAVGRIISHMYERNVHPSAHIYTMLITNYFQQEPPAIPAVDSLVEQIFTSNRTPTDSTMFDRTIQGYARHGEVGKMMSVLTRMSKIGILPSYPSLTAVIEALVHDGDYDRARDIVRDVQSGVGVGRSGITGGKTAEGRFFALVKSFGLDRDGQSSARQVQDDWDGSSARKDVTGAEMIRQEQESWHEDKTAGTSQHEDVAGAQWLESVSMGNFMFNDRAIKASRNERVLGDQLRAQEIQQMVQREEVQEEMERQPTPTPTPTHQPQTANLQYTQHSRNPVHRVKQTSSPQHQSQLAQVQSSQEPGSIPHEQKPSSTYYEQTPADTQQERSSRSAPTPDEEDVHGFLKDEHDDYHSNVDKSHHHR